LVVLVVTEVGVLVVLVVLEPALVVMVETLLYQDYLEKFPVVAAVVAVRMGLPPLVKEVEFG
jgi:hypothetical protein